MVQDLSARTLLVILVVAVIQDFMYMKISNRLIIMGVSFSLAFSCQLYGLTRFIYWFANLSFPVILLYLLYLLGIIGAGDIKLFSIIGGFTNFRISISCMLFSFVAAAVIAVGKLLYNRNFKGSMIRAHLFFSRIKAERIESYHKVWAEQCNLMHFSVAILIGYVLAVAGPFSICG